MSAEELQCLRKLLDQKLGLQQRAQGGHDNKMLSAATGICESDITKFFAGAKRRESTIERYLTRFAEVLGMPLHDLKDQMGNQAINVADETDGTALEEKERLSVLDAIEVLHCRGNQLSADEKHILAEGVCCLVQSIASPSLALLEMLADQASAMPNLRLSGYCDYREEFVKLLLAKMPFVLKSWTKSSGRVWALYQRLCSSVEDMCGQRISNRVIGRSRRS